jgi:hypothetical protein
MLAYKVVEKNTRHCSNWAIHKSESEYPNFKFRKKHIEYFPRYLKGKTVHAVEGSEGILTFRYVRDASRFINSNFCVKLIIILVEGTGPREVKYLNSGCGSSPEDVLGIYPNMLAPTGTMGFESVKVLE